MRVLAAIVNFEGAAMSVAALGSLLEQSVATEVRIVVIDNASSAADVRGLEAGISGRASLVRLETNRGYAAACNVASSMAADAGIPYVLWLNNDLLLEQGLVEAMVARLDAAPGTAAVGAVTVDFHTGSRVLGAGMDLSLWRGEVRHRRMGLGVAKLPDAPYAVDVIAATCMLVRISALRDIGGMDESYFMYGEDVDWSIRARQRGFDLEIVPQARARHGGARSSPPQAQVRFILRNRVRLMRARAGLATQGAFVAYFVLAKLPAYTVARLVPRFGLRAGIGIAISSLSWNIRDARRRGRWRLRAEDQVIPPI